MFLWNPGRGTCVLAAALIAGLSFTAARTASALDIAACDQFAWPIKREQALFASKDLQHVASGTTLDSVPDRGIALELQPHDTAPYVLAPSRQPKIGSYQVTASAEAWIEIIQDGKSLASTAHSGKRDCPDVRKSVRFDLQTGAVTIQVSGVDSKLIKLAILPAE